jgi:hypothetical protein
MIVITPDSDDDVCKCGRGGGFDSRGRELSPTSATSATSTTCTACTHIYYVLEQEIPGFAFGQGTQYARGKFVGAKQVEVKEQGMNICSQHAPRISSSSSLPKMALNTSSLGRSASSASFLSASTAAPGSA